jgi:hypothetical protein
MGLAHERFRDGNRMSTCDSQGQHTDSLAPRDGGVELS